MGFYGEIIGTLGLGEIAGMLDYNIINYGGKAVYIDGFSSIIKIDENEIVLGIKKDRIVVEGELSIHRLEERSIIIKGKVVSVIVKEAGSERNKQAKD